jgi:hypothetical protein
MNNKYSISAKRKQQLTRPIISLVLVNLVIISGFINQSSNTITLIVNITLTAIALGFLAVKVYQYFIDHLYICDDYIEYLSLIIVRKIYKTDIEKIEYDSGIIIITLKKGKTVKIKLNNFQSEEEIKTDLSFFKAGIK